MQSPARSPSRCPGSRDSKRSTRPRLEAIEPQLLLAGISTTDPIGAEQPTGGIATGAVGSIWYSVAPNDGVSTPPAGAIERIKLATHQTIDFPLPTKGESIALIAGPGNLLSFLDRTADAIGTLDPFSGRFVEYPIPTANTSPDSLTVGPGGTVWFNERVRGALGEFNPATGKITEFPMPTAADSPRPSPSAPTATSGLRPLSRSAGSTRPRIRPASSAPASPTWSKDLLPSQTDGFD